ncbi:MAG: hypothetical protein JW730_22320 [Anaerolineales bacterium]|nr:hypothetical protein [Anaerolineales bacterium]
MTRNTRTILAVVCLALAGLACQALPAGGAGQLPFSDDFSSEQWGTGSDADSSIAYADNALQMILFKKNHFVYSTLNDESYQNLHIEVTAINNDTDSTTAFGIICHQQSGTNDFYYVAVTPAGEFAIVKSAEGQSDVFLTNDNQWAASEAIVKEAPSYRVGADCGNGTVTLYVDGQQIASVSDASYTSGGIALFVWSGENAATTNVSFDDFLMTALP